MLKKLRKLLNCFHCFNGVGSFRLTKKIGLEEKIARTVFSPINVNKDGTRIKANLFKPPPDSDELSVNRLSFASYDFCKRWSKKIANPANDRSYFGLAILFCKDIFDANCEIIATPLRNNKYHADIKIGYIVKRGEPLPSEYQWKVNQMVERAMFLQDRNPESPNWLGDTV